MKYILIIIFILLQFSSNAQKKIYEDSIVLKKGIYKSFEELRDNNPSLALNYTIIQESLGFGFLSLEGSHIYYRLNTQTNKDVKDIGTIWGFCDGKNIYINTGMPKLKKNTHFELVQFLGYNSIFETVVTKQNIGVYTGIGYGGGASVSSTRMLECNILNFAKGEVVNISKSNLKSIISSDSVLFKQFKNEDVKNEKIKDYLIIYINNHKNKPLNINYLKFLNNM